MTIGVGVEGASERVFWTKVLHKNFRSIRFDVRNLKNKERLIRATPQLLDAFRSLHYSAGFILVDRHRDPCTTAVLDRFDYAIQVEARKPQDERFLSTESQGATKEAVEETIRRNICAQQDRICRHDGATIRSKGGQKAIRFTRLLLGTYERGFNGIGQHRVAGGRARR